MKYETKIIKYSDSRYKVQVTFHQTERHPYGMRTFSVDAEQVHGASTVNACATGELSLEEIEGVCEALRLAGDLASGTLRIED